MPTDKVKLDELSACWSFNLPSSVGLDGMECLVCGSEEYCPLNIPFKPDDEFFRELQSIGYYRERFHDLWHNEGEPNV
jgi:hypothetical protein